MRRRTVLGSGVGAVLAGIAGCTGSIVDEGDDLPERSPRRIDGAWRMANNDGRNSRRSAGDGVRTEPTVEWERTVSGSPNGDPLLADSLVYCPTFGGVTHVFEAATGESYVETDDLYAVESVAVEDGTVYGGHVESEEFAAYDLESAAPEWTVSIDEHPFAPAVADGTVYVQTAAIPDASGSATYAFDANDGTKRWRLETAGLPKGVVVGPETVWATTEDAILAGSKDGGNERWTESVASGTVTRATSAGDRLVYGHGTAVSAIDGTGEVRWTVDGFDGPVASLAADEDVVYAGSEAETMAIDVADGRRDWTTDVDASIATTVTDEVLYAGGYGRIVGLDRADGSRLWDLSLGEPLTTGPIAGEGALFAATRSQEDGETVGTVYALTPP